MFGINNRPIDKSALESQINELKKILETYKGTYKEIFIKLCKEKGVNPNEIIQLIKGEENGHIQ